MEQNSNVSKVIIKDETFYLQLIWKENETDLFHINICGLDSAWTGRYSMEFARKYMEHVEENEEQYYSIVKKALSDNNKNISEDYTIIYDFVKMSVDSASAKFTWKKKFNEAELEHGSVPVHGVNFNTVIFGLLDCLIEQNLCLDTVIKECIDQNKEISTDLAKCKEQLQQYVSIKDSLESSLYGKFINILNSKKKRIKVLEDNLQQHSNQNEEE